MEEYFKGRERARQAQAVMDAQKFGSGTISAAPPKQSALLLDTMSVMDLVAVALLA